MFEAFVVFGIIVILFVFSVVDSFSKRNTRGSAKYTSEKEVAGSEAEPKNVVADFTQKDEIQKKTIFYY